MPAEPKHELRLAIAHVLFVDIVGYSSLLTEEQSEALQQLNELARATRAFRDAEAANQLISLPTGDGMALIFTSTAEAPMDCALQLSEALKTHPDLRVRMGVHSGPVHEVPDVNHRTNVAGAGINMAQRVMDCGDAGHILVSQRVADDLAQYRHWQACLHPMGECEVKHGVTVSVANLFTDAAGNPELPAKFAFPKSAAPTPARFTLSPRILLAAVLAILVAGIVWFAVHRPTPERSRRPISASPAEAQIPEKSIAVLPFENLSDEKQNAYFADGVQDEILTDLARIADLKVISRSSVMRYKSGTTRNPRKIGGELGVAHLLEGSVQRASGKVRVNAQLIDTRTDAHLWAQTYDRDLADVFAIQSEIAKAIADQLEAKLSPGEAMAIAQRPTNDILAFDLYSRARTLLLDISFNTVAVDNFHQAIELLNQAVARDPAFFLAYCRLAEAHDQLYLTFGDHTPARLALGEAAVQRTLELRPDSGEAHLALAQHRYRGYRDYDGARAELALAARLLPNEPLIYELASYIDRRRGRWDDSVRNAEQAIALDPRNVSLMQQTALTYFQLRDYARMAAVLDRALAVAPNEIATRMARAQVDFHWRADTRPLQRTIDSILAENPAAAAAIADNWLNLALCLRDAAAGNRAIIALGSHVFGQSEVVFNGAFGEAWIAQIRGDTAAAKESFEVARAQQAEALRGQPHDAGALCSLGLIDAMLGRKDDALAEGRHALELLPASKDAVSGSEIAAFFAAICAWSGERELALSQLDSVTKMPCYLSYGQLRLQPYWNPLRGDPRFEQIVESLAPKE